MKLYSGHIAYFATLAQNTIGLPYLLMLHGFMGSGKVFQPHADSLKPFSNPARLDLLGHGRSEGSADPWRYRTQQQLRDLDSILDRLQFSPLLLYGYSMGGRLALQYAVHYPGRIVALILESTSFGIVEPAKREERAQVDQQRARQIERDYPGFLNQWKRKPLFSASSADASHEKKYEEVMRSQNPSWMAACLRGFGSGVMPPLSGRLNTLDLPVLLISGSLDEKFVSIHSRMADRLPDARSEVIDGASHRVHLDRPRAWAGAIENYIKKLRL